MEYNVGQIIVGRGITRLNKGEVKDFKIEKIGKKYIYLVEVASTRFSIPVNKETLECKDEWPQWEFFHSTKAMEDHDESQKLLKEIREIVDRASINTIEREKLKKIRDLLN